MRRLLLSNCVSIAVLLLGGACDEEPELPPENAQPTSRPGARFPDVDIKHTATILADSKVSLSNLIFVFQPDPASPGKSGITVATSRPLADGSRMVFGAVEPVGAIEMLTRSPVHFGGAAVLDLTGSGVFTPLYAYQPKFAELRVKSVDDAEVIGTIKGQFYRFQMANPIAKPTVKEIEISFTASRFKP